ncbi:MAG: DNA-directed RNA polymerase subunit delta [Candidatus Aphodocola sp.]
MNVRQMPLEDLELLSYTDIAYELLKLDKKSRKTNDLFKEVCNLLQISEDDMLDMIGDFYTTLTTDKRFILLDTAEWDLRDAHSVKTIIDDEEDEEADDEEEETEEEPEETEDEAVTDNIEDFDDQDDDMDDLEDLAIVSEEEMDE